MKFETNYLRARTIRGRESIQGRGSRCANYSRARTNRMKFETNYLRARTIRGRESIQGRGSRCANYSRARTNRGRELFGLVGYYIELGSIVTVLPQHGLSCFPSI